MLVPRHQAGSLRPQRQRQKHAASPYCPANSTPDAGTVAKAADGLRIVTFDQTDNSLTVPPPCARPCPPTPTLSSTEVSPTTSPPGPSASCSAPTTGPARRRPLRRRAGTHPHRPPDAPSGRSAAARRADQRPGHRFAGGLGRSLEEFPGALVLVTHDRSLLDRLCTDILGLDGQGGARMFADFTQWTAAQRNCAKPRPRQSPVPRPVKPHAPKPNASLIRNSASGTRWKLASRPPRNWCKPVTSKWNPPAPITCPSGVLPRVASGPGGSGKAVRALAGVGREAGGRVIVTAWLLSSSGHFFTPKELHNKAQGRPAQTRGDIIPCRIGRATLGFTNKYADEP